MMKRKIWLFGLLLSFFVSLHASRQDSIRFSLLTCSPGQEVYSLFGHTAIRYQNFTRSTDVAFNYGMFSFNTPNFILRFVKGETDYHLGVSSFIGFYHEYASRGSTVYEQELNLTEEEKLTLQQLLFTNFQPENRVYRYNYFYDNCTTRARDQIEKCIRGKIVYPEGRKNATFRKIIREYTAPSPWFGVGIDYCLGAEADEEIGIRFQMFSPFDMRNFASEAYIENEDGTKRPLVVQETKVVDVPPLESEPGFFLSPMTCALIFMLVNFWIAFLQYKRRRIYWGWDLFLYTTQGIAGCLLATLFFFSIHPTVGSNWMLALLHPLALLYLPWMAYRMKKGKKDYFSWVNSVYLTFFIIVFPFLPQDFDLTVLPLTLGLLANAASHVLVTNK